jgi:hypothetical protein
MAASFCRCLLVARTRSGTCMLCIPSLIDGVRYTKGTTPTPIFISIDPAGLMMSCCWRIPFRHTPSQSLVGNSRYATAVFYEWAHFIAPYQGGFAQSYRVVIVIITQKIVDI